MWKLVIEDDEGKRTVVPLSRDEYTLGRREGNTIRLTERNISRDHAKVRRKPGAKETYVLEDAQSYNGVHVNGLRVAEPIELQHGDLIQVGDYRIVFQDDSMTEATAPYVPVSEVEATKKTLPMANAFRGSLLMERPTRLVMLVGPTPGVEFPIETELTTVGRSEECTVSIDHNSVSRVHCEIHALGEGRYEIVDKGSSNGVRVNGADLRRGIIEAGDLIELGDVRFKFVGAGQVFIPGANESQQLTAISDRQVELADRRPKPAKGSVVPYMMLGAVVAALLVGGGYYALARNGNGPPAGGTTGDAIVDYEKGKLDEAVAVCAKGATLPACDEAYGSARGQIREASPIRTSTDYRTFEAKWAEGLIQRAQATADVAAKNALLQRVEATTSLDAAIRAKATALIVHAEKPETPPPPATETAATASAPTGAHATAPTAPVVVVTPPPPETTAHPTVAPPQPTAPTAPPPSVTAAPTAKPSATAKPEKPVSPLEAAIKDANWAQVKSILLPRMSSLGCGDLQTLKTACRETGDACAKAAGQLRVDKGCTH
ncbi:MAG: FHA domain-containing protein [Myxococcales bacterium]|jgi:pSer/pThr/pTyr-binding forkhead associated (FHA) protein|nr:FHA domain-containing protein [Myxococcales bacterium]